MTEQEAMVGYVQLSQEYDAAGAAKIAETNFDLWLDWNARLQAAWLQVLVARGDATDNHNGTITLINGNVLRSDGRSE